MADQFSSNSLQNVRTYRIRPSPNFNKLGISLKQNELGMSVVSEVEPSSPFERSGVNVGDVILRVNEQSVFGERLPKIANLIQNSYKNGFVKLDVFQLTPPPKTTIQNFDPKKPRLISIARKRIYEPIGFELKFIKSEKRYKAINVQSNLAAFNAGLRDDDNILEINGEKIYLLDKSSTDEIISSQGKNIDLLVISDLDEYLRIAQGENQPRGADEISNSENLKTIKKKAPKTKVCYLVSSDNYGGFGFSIKANESGPQIIALVEENSPSESAGLKSNDLLIKINEKNVADISYHKLLNILQNECKNKFLNLEILRPETKDCDNYCDISRSISLTDKLNDKSTNSLSSINYNKTSVSLSSLTSQHQKIDYYTLKKLSSSTSLGINLGSNGLICSINPDSIGDKSGLKVYQRIVEINGYDVRDKTNQEIAEFIKDKYDLKLGVIDENSKNLQNFDQFPKFKRCVINLTADFTNGFGFTLNAKIKPKLSIFSVETKSPAYEANLRSSDILIEIDGNNVRKTGFEKVRKMLAEAKIKGRVEILAIEKTDYQKLKKLNKSLSKNLSTDQNTTFYSNINKIENSNLHLCEFTTFDESLGFAVKSSKQGIFEIVDIIQDSPGDKCGLRNNDEIIEINGTKVEDFTYDELVSHLLKKKQERNLKILVRR